MPAANIEEVLATKPVTFNIKTVGGSWKCQIHSNRAAYERVRAAQTAPAPGLSRTDSDLSTTSTVSTSSKSSH
ncbi:hypothetical protein O1611_g5715 [Lasiodiplodia mahajangana]|uniref:Uncharacterized protein n=1 Tax=Lasiodiplodia mahajangana TaxID=1108764 RepID=A0ACC2JKG4_9PEZI|nr:hypothetical protein O1611_g5715 [Lasiodiplodia mahajangana]